MLGDVSILVNSNEPGGVTLSRLLLQRSLLMRENVTLECLQSVFKGFGTGIIHPTLTCSHKRKFLHHIFLRVRCDIPLPWCLQEAWGGGWGQGVSPLVDVDVPASCPVAPGPTGGVGFPWCLRVCRAEELCCQGRAVVHERLAGEIESCVPAHRCTLPSKGASLGGSSLHPTEQIPLGRLPGAWEPSHPEVSVLGRL